MRQAIPTPIRVSNFLRIVHHLPPPVPAPRSSAMKLLLSSPLTLAASSAFAVDANRLTFLDDPSPYWPTPKSPKIINPQGVGEPGGEGVGNPGIGVLREPVEAETEAVLFAILDRLCRSEADLV